MSPREDGPPIDPGPAAGPVLVTGAGGFLGGHIARHLAARGLAVRGLARRPPDLRAGDPPIDWLLGDLLNPADLRRAVAGARAVVHAAGWVSLGRDPRGLARRVNVDATARLLDAARAAGARRFVFTSTLHTVAAGTAGDPATEDSPWNLHRVDSPYCRSKREAEALVLRANGPDLATLVLCPGMVLGPRDPKPTSTRLLRALASSPVALLPGGGIPILDSRVAALAHARALVGGLPGSRYALVGPYFSYFELAREVARLARWPRRVLLLPDPLEGPLRALASLAGLLLPGSELSPTTVSGGFLRLHVSGSRADLAFSLLHPPLPETLSLSLLAP